MKFILSKDHGQSDCIVSLSRPAPGGKTNEYRVKLDIKILGQDRLEEIAAISMKGEYGDRQFVEEVVTGWHEVADENENDLPFSDEALKLLLNFPGAPKAIVGAYYARLEQKGKKGN